MATHGDCIERWLDCTCDYCFRRRSLSVCAERSTEALFDGFGRFVVVPPMTLGNMRQLGAQNLIASCFNDACRHTALIDVSHYPVRDRSIILPQPRGVREVREPGQQDRRASELERAATRGGPDRQGVAIIIPTYRNDSQPEHFTTLTGNLRLMPVLRRFGHPKSERQSIHGKTRIALKGVIVFRDARHSPVPTFGAPQGQFPSVAYHLRRRC